MPPPLMFSTTTGLPHARANWSATIRASVSVVDPPADGTTSLTARDGKTDGDASGARPGEEPKRAAMSAIIAMRRNACIMPSLPSKSLPGISGRRSFARRCRNVAFRHIQVDGGAVAQVWIAITAAAGGLHQKALPGLHLVAARCRRLEFIRGAEPHHKPAASARPATGKPLRRKA